MTIKELDTRITNLEAQMAALASRPITARAELASNDAKAARSKAEGYDKAITTLALAQEELFTEIIPEMLEETEE